MADSIDARLDAAESEVQAPLVLARENARPVAPDASLGRLTRQDAMQAQQMAEARVGRLVQRLRLIEAARQRLADDEYGECVRCGGEIAAARLEVRPEAPMIAEIEAEAKAERRLHGRRPLGVAGVLAQDPFTRVKSKRSRAPSVLSVDKAARTALRAELKAREAMWREAAAEALALLAGAAGAARRRLPAMFWRSLAV